MRKCTILIPEMCRSTEALTKPIKERLEKEEWCTVDTIQVFAGQYTPTLNQMEDYFISRDKIDLVFLVGDRLEAGAIAQSAFINNIPICHYGGGITNNISTFDDILRHNICLMSDIELCEDLWSYSVVYDLYRTIKRKDYKIHIVGNLYLDTINDIDESLVPKEEFDLVLYNPPTSLGFELQKKEMLELYEIKKSIKHLVIFLDPNPDPKALFLPVTFPNLSRPLFLGLLKNCKRYITNSSSAFYEAPYLLKLEQIIHIGKRNRNRSTDFNEMQKYPNCADNIIKILKAYWLNKQKGE